MNPLVSPSALRRLLRWIRTPANIPYAILGTLASLSAISRLWLLLT